MTILISSLPMIAVASVSGDYSLEGNEEESPFTWWMEPRYELSWDSYDESTHSYPTSVVYPSAWEVGFDACESPLNDLGTVTAYSWHIEGDANEFEYDSGPSDDCRFDRASSPAAPGLPQQGSYTVTLTVTFSDRGPSSATEPIVIRDLLIISIGDSNASGEGNPYISPSDISEQVEEPAPPNGDKWFDERCHRSATSGHSLTAMALEEDDPHTSVTFLSFACSGGEIFEGLIYGYEGAEDPDDGSLLTPQILSVMQHLCQSTQEVPGCVANPRKIDALFISVGVNDMGFSTIIRACAGGDLSDLTVDDLWLPGIFDGLVNGDWDSIKDRPLDWLFGFWDEFFLTSVDVLLDWLGIGDVTGFELLKCHDELDPIMDLRYSALWGHFGMLNELLSGEGRKVAQDLAAGNGAYFKAWLSPSLRQQYINSYGGISPAMHDSIRPREVYVTSYPGDPFPSGGCGALSNINDSEGRWIGKQGAELNQLLQTSAKKHRWHYVGGIIEDFKSHSYCDDDSYYRHVTDSIFEQGGVRGSVHPNRSGHLVTSDNLLDVYHSEKPDWREKWDVKVIPEAVRIIDNREAPRNSFEFTAVITDIVGRHPGVRQQLEIPVGQWVSLPETGFRYRQHLADDEVIGVMGDIHLAGETFIPPKCNNPDCAVHLPGSTLKSLWVYSRDNSWGGDYDWCVEEPVIKPYSTARVCTVEVDSDSVSLEVRYRIEVVNTSLSPVADSEEWTTCGAACNSGPGTIATPVAEYLAILEAAGENTAGLEAILFFLESQIAGDDAWSLELPPASAEDFDRTWSRTDKPVLDGVVTRTWMWGPQPNTGEMHEQYAESPTEFRAVQYFDKARMEVTHPNSGDSDSIWYVTNGLLVVELITGNQQRGDDTFRQLKPADVNVAGDMDDPEGPTYATFSNLLDIAPQSVGTPITERVERSGNVADDPSLASQNISIAVVDDVTNHGIAAPFWEFMNSTGAVREDGALVTDDLFENPYFATGRPITEAYWATVKVGNVQRDVLMQCFERRCLTYTPDNASEWQVEAGNVGLHYFQWRYQQERDSAIRE